MINTQDLDYITQQVQQYPSLSHAANILTKVHSNLNSSEENALSLLVPQYAHYLQTMLSFTTYDKSAIDSKVDCLNAYYNFMHDNNLDRAFSSQGKFRSTILEEFLYLLFKDYVATIKTRYDTHDVLHSGAVKAYSNLYFKAKDLQNFVSTPEIGINEKDQDYAIYCTFDISINQGNSIQICLPVVAIEAKTYIDKTMLDTIIATAEKVKNGNPHTRFIAVTESYDVSYAVDPAYSRIDQIYVLRKSKRKNGWREIDKEVVFRLFCETQQHLELPWSDIETKIQNDGVVL